MIRSRRSFLKAAAGSLAAGSSLAAGIARGQATTAITVAVGGEFVV
jgi:hypothetical protein